MRKSTGVLPLKRPINLPFAPCMTQKWRKHVLHMRMQESHWGTWFFHSSSAEGWGLCFGVGGYLEGILERKKRGVWIDGLSRFLSKEGFSRWKGKERGREFGVFVLEVAKSEGADQTLNEQED